MFDLHIFYMTNHIFNNYYQLINIHQHNLNIFQVTPHILCMVVNIFHILQSGCFHKIQEVYSWYIVYRISKELIYCNQLIHLEICQNHCKYINCFHLVLLGHNRTNINFKMGRCRKDKMNDNYQYKKILLEILNFHFLHDQKLDQLIVLLGYLHESYYTR